VAGNTASARRYLGDPRLCARNASTILTCCWNWGAATLEGSNAIRDFYAEVKAHIHEKVEVSHYIADATGIAAELPTEFKVFKNWPEPSYFKRPLK
jgi:hypothetical protein